MLSYALSATALALCLGGALLYMARVSRGDLRPPPWLLRSGVLLAGPLSLASILCARARGEPLGLALAFAIAALSLAGLAGLLHGMRRTPLGRLTVRVGARMLPFTALTPEGAPFDSTSWDGKRILLKFFRGEWCPFCQAELKAFDAMRGELARHGVALYALSKDPPQVAQRHRERDALQLGLLCDPDLRVIRRYGVEHQRALEISKGRRISLFGLNVGLVPSFESMAIPTTLLIDEHGCIRWVDQSGDYKVRSSPERVIAAVAQVFPDLSLGSLTNTTPATREHWSVTQPIGR